MTVAAEPVFAAQIRAMRPANRQACEIARPYAWSRVVDGLPQAPCPEPVRTPAGDLLLRLGGEFLGGGGDPRAAAQQLTDASGVSDARETIVFGFGAGHAVEAALAALPAGATLTVAVVDPGSLLVTLAERDLTALFMDGRLRFALGSLSEISAALPRVTDDTAVMVQPGLAHSAAPDLTPLLTLADTLVARRRSVMQRLGCVRENIDRNLTAILAAPRASGLAQFLSCRPAILAAPGPSLVAQLALLRTAPRPALIAVDTAVNVLAAQGIEPDLVITLDPAPETRQLFAGVEFEAPLLFFESARPEVVARAQRRIFACERMGLLHRAHPFFAATGTYDTGGSVLHAALDVLIAVGAAPIVLVGADDALEPAGEGAETASVRARARARISRRLDGLPRGRVLDARQGGTTLPELDRVDLWTWLAEHRMATEPLLPAPLPPGAADGRIREEAVMAVRAALSRR